MMFSLIIPTFNRATLLSETLQSVMDQNYSNWECIVVDDGSTDNTERVVSQFINKDSRFSFYKRPKNREKGANACRNYGLEKSIGDIINWLDSDDLLEITHFEKHLKLHISSKSVDASVSQATTFIIHKSNTAGIWSNIYAEGDLIENMISSKVSWATPCVLWKKHSLPQRPFNESLSSSQEWTFHLERIISGITIKMLLETTVYVRRHANRVGKDISSKKYKATFLSRYFILKKLRKEMLLSMNNETFLLKRMMQAVKSTVKYKYDSVLYLQIKLLFNILFICKRKLTILKILFWSIPIYRIIRKGETLFKIS